MVKGAPTYAEASLTLHDMLRDAVAVTHTHFDRVATLLEEEGLNVDAEDVVVVVVAEACNEVIMGEIVLELYVRKEVADVDEDE